MTLSVKLEDLTEQEFAELWMIGVSHVIRDDPRKGYTLNEKKKGARIAVIKLITQFLKTRKGSHQS